MFDDALKAIRTNVKLTSREKFDLEMALNKVFYFQQAKKKEHERDKLKALEENLYRKYLANDPSTRFYLNDFHPMRFYQNIAYFDHH